MGRRADGALFHKPDTTKAGGWLRCDPPPEGMAALAKAPVCAFCPTKAMRGQYWCVAHRPGPRRPKHIPTNKPRKSLTLKQVTGQREGVARLLLPGVLLEWAPVVRVQAIKPGDRNPDIGLTGLVRAMVARALGNPGPWARLLEAWTRDGLLLPGDPPCPTLGDDGAALGYLLAAE